MSDIIFRGYIDETEVAMLKVGMDMELSLGSMQKITIPAKLDYIAPEGEMQNGAKMIIGGNYAFGYGGEGLCQYS